MGLAFLGTVRADGGPRLHPFCPVIDDGLYAFIVPSPKRDDLHRDGRYAMHSFPADENEDAFTLAGTVKLTEDGAVRDRLEARYRDERVPAGHDCDGRPGPVRVPDRTVPAHADDGSRGRIATACRVDGTLTAGS